MSSIQCSRCGATIDRIGDSVTKIICHVCSAVNEVTPSAMQEFAGGAKRGAANAAQAGKFPPRFDLLSPIALRRWAETFGEGFAKYGANNWLKGIPMSCCLDHAMAHLTQWMRGDETEDHLAHAAWNIMAMIHYSETNPAMDDRDPRMMDMKPKMDDSENIKES